MTDRNISISGRRCQLLDVLAKNPDAQRMERADGRAVFFVVFPSLRQKLIDALLHFARGLVREGDAKNVRRCNPPLHHVRDAKSDDARLACAGARENQNRAANGFGGEALLRVERVQVDHRARSLICREANASAGIFYQYSFMANQF